MHTDHTVCYAGCSTMSLGPQINACELVYEVPTHCDSPSSLMTTYVAFAPINHDDQLHREPKVDAEVQMEARCTLIRQRAERTRLPKDCS